MIVARARIAEREPPSLPAFAHGLGQREERDIVVSDLVVIRRDSKARDHAGLQGLALSIDESERQRAVFAVEDGPGEVLEMQ